MIDIEEIRLFSLKPGDYLVVQCNGFLTHEQANQLKQTLKDNAPDLADRTLIIDSRISLAVVSQEVGEQLGMGH